MAEDVTQILSAIERGDGQAADRLLPLVYDELRRLAAQKLAHEKPGQTLQPTALVHEAYIRLVGGDCEKYPIRTYNDRGHFFAAAATAMAHICCDTLVTCFLCCRRSRLDISPRKLNCELSAFRFRCSIRTVQPAHLIAKHRLLSSLHSTACVETKDSVDRHPPSGSFQCRAHD